MDDPLQPYLTLDDDLLEACWSRLQQVLRSRFGRETGIEAVLFLIGVQSHGRGYEPKLAREVKQDFIMEGTYCAFEKLGFYERVGMDEAGSWIWERRVASLPKLTVEEQEKLLRVAILAYFDDLFPEDDLLPEAARGV